MPDLPPFSAPVKPDWEAFVRCLRREGTPKRVHFIELFLDREVQDELCHRYGLGPQLDPGDPKALWKREVALQRFLGYDYVRARLVVNLPLKGTKTADTAALPRSGGRGYIEEHRGPIGSWREFEEYPWPDPGKLDLGHLEWLERNLPDDMCVIASGAHFAEWLTWLTGYETFCYLLHDDRPLIQALYDRILSICTVLNQTALQFSRVKIVWGSDDMGYRQGLLFSPEDLRRFALSGHKHIAGLAHERGCPYLLHSCGNLSAIYEELIEEVKIDAKHSFEDVIEDVTEMKRRYGRRLSLLGGIDVDFLCRAAPEQVRERVARTLAVCQPGGGYALGTGNSVANYIPVDNYLAMLDAGRRFSG
jgi:uroporphyrinogen decarboxylase